MIGYIISFFQSSFFVALTTILTGVAAWFVYKSQLRTTKIQAGRVLLTEIQTAEDRIRQINDMLMSDGAGGVVMTNISLDFPTIFPSRSWNMYSHLFISDFDSDELKLISRFYDFGGLIEDFGKRNNDFFWVTTEERARVTQQKIAEIIVSKSDFPKDIRDIAIKEGVDFLSNSMNIYANSYTPKKTVSEMYSYLQKIETITTSSCGIKLKKLAKL
ncbi:MAG: hypothetical protein NT003_00465 [Candidatus Magasanikbacteria bacterium]|nr:hypothetical protein [Candidatus Magasanikbacteria bacterium]